MKKNDYRQVRRIWHGKFRSHYLKISHHQGYHRETSVNLLFDVLSICNKFGLGAYNLVKTRERDVIIIDDDKP